VQEKTVLVGYACHAHSMNGSGGVFSKTQDIIDDAADCTEGSDDGDSIFSTAITLSRATSFIAAEEQDTIDEILQILVDDPLLSWEKLFRHQSGDPSRSDVKDVRFFLRAFEIDLREAADSAIEYHACAFFRSRIRYLSSQICERFNLKESAALDHFLIDDEEAPASVQQLQPVTLDEPDPTLMPPFSRIRSFMFGGFAFQTLKENVKNFTQNTRDYLGEVTNIIIKNIHPPDMASAKLSLVGENPGSLSEILGMFLPALEKEAILCNLSASDRVGIKNIQSDTLQLKTRVSTAWTSEVPLWHFYPPVPGNSTCLQPNFLSTKDLECKSEYEIFEEFICSSGAFLNLAHSVTGLSQKDNWALRLSRFLALFYSQGTSAISSSYLDKTAISFECVS
jgi:hypothetical protein